MTRARVALDVAAFGALAVGFGFAMWAPTDVVQLDFVRIMYVHVPSAWLAFLAFGVTLVGGVVWLLTRRWAWDRLAAASAEVGVFFTGLALVTGMIWGRPVWGVWWDWGDARMMSTALMFFVYLGYLALRRSTPDAVSRARRSSVLGIVAFVQVPLVYLSVILWRTLHQTPSIRPDDTTMDSRMLVALLVNVAAFTLLYAALTRRRVQLGRLQDV